MTFDVEIPTDTSAVGQMVAGPCGAGLVLVEEEGVDEQDAINELVPCSVNRVWILQVGDLSVILFRKPGRGPARSSESR